MSVLNDEVKLGTKVLKNRLVKSSSQPRENIANELKIATLNNNFEDYINLERYLAKIGGGLVYYWANSCY